MPPINDPQNPYLPPGSQNTQPQPPPPAPVDDSPVQNWSDSFASAFSPAPEPAPPPAPSYGSEAVGNYQPASPPMPPLTYGQDAVTNYQQPWMPPTTYVTNDQYFTPDYYQQQFNQQVGPAPTPGDGSLWFGSAEEQATQYGWWKSELEKAISAGDRATYDALMSEFSRVQDQWRQFSGWSEPGGMDYHPGAVDQYNARVDKFLNQTYQFDPRGEGLRRQQDPFTTPQAMYDANGNLMLRSDVQREYGDLMQRQSDFGSSMAMMDAEAAYLGQRQNLSPEDRRLLASYDTWRNSPLSSPDYLLNRYGRDPDFQAEIAKNSPGIYGPVGDGGVMMRGIDALGTAAGSALSSFWNAEPFGIPSTGSVVGEALHQTWRPISYASGLHLPGTDKATAGGALLYALDLPVRSVEEAIYLTAVGTGTNSLNPADVARSVADQHQNFLDWRARNWSWLVVPELLGDPTNKFTFGAHVIGPASKANRAAKVGMEARTFAKLVEDGAIAAEDIQRLADLNPSWFDLYRMQKTSDNVWNALGTASHGLGKLTPYWDEFSKRLALSLTLGKATGDDLSKIAQTEWERIRTKIAEEHGPQQVAHFDRQTQRAQRTLNQNLFTDQGVPNTPQTAMSEQIGEVVGEIGAEPDWLRHTFEPEPVLDAADSTPPTPGAATPPQTEVSQARAAAAVLDLFPDLAPVRTVQPDLAIDASTAQARLIEFFSRRDGVSYWDALAERGDTSSAAVSNLIGEVNAQDKATLSQLSELLRVGRPWDEVRELASKSRADVQRVLDQVKGQDAIPDIDTRGFMSNRAFRRDYAERVGPARAKDAIGDSRPTIAQINLAWERSKAYGVDLLRKLADNPNLTRATFGELISTENLPASPAQKRYVRGLVQRKAVQGADIDRLTAAEADRLIRAADAGEVQLAMDYAVRVPSETATPAQIAAVQDARQRVQVRAALGDWFRQHVPFSGGPERVTDLTVAPLGPVAFQDLLTRHRGELAGTRFAAAADTIASVALHSGRDGAIIRDTASETYDAAVRALLDDVAQASEGETDILRRILHDAYYRSNIEPAVAPKTAPGRAVQTAQGAQPTRQQVEQAGADGRRARRTALERDRQALTRQITLTLAGQGDPDKLAGLRARATAIDRELAQVNASSYADVQPASSVHAMRLDAADRQLRSLAPQAPERPALTTPPAEAAPAASDLDVAAAALDGAIVDDLPVITLGTNRPSANAMDDWLDSIDQRTGKRVRDLPTPGRAAGGTSAGTRVPLNYTADTVERMSDADLAEDIATLTRIIESGATRALAQSPVGDPVMEAKAALSLLRDEQTGRGRAVATASSARRATDAPAMRSRVEITSEGERLRAERDALEEQRRKLGRKKSASSAVDAAELQRRVSTLDQQIATLNREWEQVDAFFGQAHPEFENDAAYRQMRDEAAEIRREITTRNRTKVDMHLLPELERKADDLSRRADERALELLRESSDSGRGLDLAAGGGGGTFYSSLSPITPETLRVYRDGARQAFDSLAGMAGHSTELLVNYLRGRAPAISSALRGAYDRIREYVRALETQWRYLKKGLPNPRLRDGASGRFGFQEGLAEAIYAAVPYELAATLRLDGASDLARQRGMARAWADGVLRKAAAEGDDSALQRLYLERDAISSDLAGGQKLDRQNRATWESRLATIERDIKVLERGDDPALLSGSHVVRSVTQGIPAGVPDEVAEVFGRIPKVATAIEYARVAAEQGTRFDRQLAARVVMERELPKVAEKYGVKESVFNDFLEETMLHPRGREAAQILDAFSELLSGVKLPGVPDDARRVAAAQYELTQRVLADLGVPEEIALYRGVSAGNANVADRMSWWSSSLEHSQSYAGRDGQLYMATVPREAIAYSSLTNPYAMSKNPYDAFRAGNNEWIVDGRKVKDLTPVMPGMTTAELALGGDFDGVSGITRALDDYRVGHSTDPTVGIVHPSMGRFMRPVAPLLDFSAHAWANADWATVGPKLDAFVDRYYSPKGLLDDERRVKLFGKTVHPTALGKSSLVQRAGDLVAADLSRIIDEAYQAEEPYEFMRTAIRERVGLLKSGKASEVEKADAFYTQSKVGRETLRLYREYGDYILSRFEALTPHSSLADLVDDGILPAVVDGHWTQRQLKFIDDVLNSRIRPANLTPGGRHQLKVFRDAFKDRWNTEVMPTIYADGQFRENVHVMREIDPLLFPEEASQVVDLPKLSERIGSAVAFLHGKKIGYNADDIPPMLRLMQTVKGNLAPLWMTVWPQWHINNLSGNVGAQVLGATRHDLHVGVKPLLDERWATAVERAGSGVTRHPYLADPFGTPTPVNESITGQRREYLVPKLINKTPGAGHYLRAAENAGGAVEQKFREIVYSQEWGHTYTETWRGRVEALVADGRLTRSQADELVGVVGLDEVNRIVDAAGLDDLRATLLAGQRQAIATATHKGYSTAREVLRDYRMRNKIDGVLDRFLPVHYWTTKNMAFVTKTALDRPATILNAGQVFNEWAETNDHLPPSLRTGTLPIQVPEGIPGIGGREFHLRLAQLTNPVLFALPRMLDPDRWNSYSDMSLPDRLLNWGKDGFRNFWTESGYRIGPQWDYAVKVSNLAATRGPLKDNEWVNRLVGGANFIAEPRGYHTSWLPLGGIESQLNRSKQYTRATEWMNSLFYGSPYTKSEVAQFGRAIAERQYLGKIDDEEARGLLRALSEGNFDDPGVRDIVDKVMGNKASTYLVGRLGLSGTEYTDSWRAQYRANREYQRIVETEGVEAADRAFYGQMHPALRYLIDQRNAGKISDAQLSAALEAGRDGQPNALLKQAWDATNSHEAIMAQDDDFWRSMMGDQRRYDLIAEDAGYSAANQWAFGTFNSKTGQTEGGHAPWLSAYWVANDEGEKALAALDRADARTRRQDAWVMRDAFYKEQREGLNAAAPYYARGERADQQLRDDLARAGDNLYLQDAAYRSHSKWWDSIRRDAVRAGVELVGSGNFPNEGNQHFNRTQAERNFLVWNDALEAVEGRERMQQRRGWVLDRVVGELGLDIYIDVPAPTSDPKGKTFTVSVPNPDWWSVDPKTGDLVFDKAGWEEARQAAAERAPIVYREMTDELRAMGYDLPGDGGVKAADFLYHTASKHPELDAWREQKRADLDRYWNDDTLSTEDRDKLRVFIRQTYGGDALNRHPVYEDAYPNTAREHEVYNEGARTVEQFYHSLTYTQREAFREQYPDAFEQVEQTDPNSGETYTSWQIDGTKMTAEQLRSIRDANDLYIGANANSRAGAQDATTRATTAIVEENTRVENNTRIRETVNAHNDLPERSAYFDFLDSSGQEQIEVDGQTLTLEEAARQVYNSDAAKTKSGYPSWKKAAAIVGEDSQLGQYILARKTMSDAAQAAGQVWFDGLPEDLRGLILADDPDQFSRYAGKQDDTAPTPTTTTTTPATTTTTTPAPTWQGSSSYQGQGSGYPSSGGGSTFSVADAYARARSQSRYANVPPWLLQMISSMNLTTEQRNVFWALVNDYYSKPRALRNVAGARTKTRPVVEVQA